jgi:TRAP-type uncharacterized transport system substrate-binding protein
MLKKLACLFATLIGAVSCLAQLSSLNASTNAFGPPQERHAKAHSAELARQTSTKRGNRPAEQNTVGLVTGDPLESDFALAQEIATVLSTGQESGPNGEVALRILPMVGKGGYQNIRDLLTLPQADLTILPAALLSSSSDSVTKHAVRSKLVYIAPLATAEFHLLVRDEIATLADLAGKGVNVGAEGSSTEALARRLFQQLNLKTREVNVSQKEALEGMRRGDIAGTVLVSGKPITALLDLSLDDGFRLLAIPGTLDLDDAFLPATLAHEDYPKLIKPGGRLETVAFTTVLVAYDWPKASERYRLLQTFIQMFFARLPEFQATGRHPKWREVNLAGAVPGLRRFAPAQRWIANSRQNRPEAVDKALFESFMRERAPTTKEETEKLFQNFLDWKRRRSP